MKTISLLLAAACLLALATVASADSSTYSATLLSEATGSSSAVRLYGYPVKQLIVGHVSGTSFANYSGTMAAYGSQSASGPWYPLKDVQGVAISKTHDTTASGAVYNIDDLTQYIKVTFTATSGAAKNKITAILNYAGRLISP